MIRKRPWMVIIAGPNGAGKSTFYDKVIKDDPLMKKCAVHQFGQYCQRYVRTGSESERQYAQRRQNHL